MNLSKLGSLLYRGVEFLCMNISASHKVTMTLDYRRRWQSFLPKKSPELPSLWIHGASVGELEDLAAFYGNAELVKKAGYSQEQLIITSSSPSAEEFLEKLKKKINPLYAGPIPPDVLPRVKEFFNFLKPELLILSQSDVWPVLLSIAKDNLAKGAIWLPHKEQSAAWARNMLLAPIVKTVGQRRQEAPNPLPSARSEFVGSPRIDRILERIQESKSKPHPLQDILPANDKTSSKKIRILIGSAWKEDAKLMSEALSKIRLEDQNKFEVIVIPHDTKNPTEVSAISSYLGKNIISREGILLEAYNGFALAFVGGAFRTGLHNIIEPLAWGIPTFCGTDTHKQPDAPFYISQGSLKRVNNSEDLRELLIATLEDNFLFKEWKEKAKDAQQLLSSQSGASERLVKLINES
ncbi:MAG: glycosyltransferase N-terminal domain-containing protein [Bdellovibrionota bacterium]